MSEKKLRKSPVVIALYVIAALLLVYAFIQVGSTISYISSYYKSYSMTPKFGETVTYVLQAIYQPLVMAILMGAAGYILNEVRALNPAYYATKAEVEAIKAAKKAEKEAAKQAKNEAAQEAAEQAAEQAEKEEAVEETAKETEEEK